MSPSQVPYAMHLAAAEGWNPGLHDATSFHAADPEGFLMAELEGEPVGCISAVSYPGGFGFIGLYIVEPEFRGRGIGRALWRQAMQRLNGVNIGLDGVVAMQEAYARSGFKLAYRNIRYAASHLPSPGPLPAGVRLVPAAEVPFEDLRAYDRRFFPADREAFLRKWIRQPSGWAVAALGADGLQGMGVIRSCREGHKVGPLFADNPEMAKILLLTLASRRNADARVILDVPAVNPAAISLAQEVGMEVIFETARMYTGDPPLVDLEGTFGVTTFELG
ncbi:GNAT family N-acetyltransferase [Verrucomicrobium sp. BvORR106]|uniref:GNAT family N-acetyltransferase n=1 Tax=Verrucomicrobium sp. BvORR106 TaxID=1403819 RepID=UPI00056E2343|nr:GNAT family N-acetyltransferase [Verrucomicrobium sp. BvORR106]